MPTAIPLPPCRPGTSPSAARVPKSAKAATNAETLATLTSSYARAGAGLDADYRRAVTERDRQRKEVLQPIQALAQARSDYLDAVLAYNRDQFRLYRALGRPPLLATFPGEVGGHIGRGETTQSGPK